MRVGIIDCGTNTFNLLIAEKHEQEWRVIFENKLAVKLGAGGFEKKTIIASRFIRGIDALQCHVANAQNFGCKKIKGFATSAIREASNGREFLKVAKQKFNLDIELIEGDREAELIWKGIRQTIALGEEKHLIMDIGGGSTEFVIANDHHIFWKGSYLLGVSRLHEFISPSDRITTAELQKLHNRLDEVLIDLKNALLEHPCNALIGSSGSFDTLYALYKYGQKELRDEPYKLLNEIPVQSFPKMYNWLIQSSYEERLNHPAIPSIRAEYMPLAVYLIKYIMNTMGVKRLLHSQYALKEGAAAELMEDIPVVQSKKNSEGSQETTSTN